MYRAGEEKDELVPPSTELPVSQPPVNGEIGSQKKPAVVVKPRNQAAGDQVFPQKSSEHKDLHEVVFFHILGSPLTIWKEHFDSYVRL